MPTATWLPADRLKEEPVIASLTDLEKALEELAALDTRGKSLDAARDAELDRIRSQCESVKLVPVGRKEIPIADRRAALYSAVEAYCSASREDLLGDGKKKSRKLAAGEIGWRAKRKSVSFAEGQDEKSVLKTFEKRDVSKLLNKCLASIKWFAGHMGIFLKIKLSLDKTGVLKAYESGDISEKCLQEAGLTIAGGEDEFYVSLNDYRAA